MKKERLIVVVDMVNGFCKKGNLASPKFMETIVPNIKKLLDIERKRGSKILFLQDYHKPNDPEFKLFPPHCIRGTDEVEIIQELEFHYRPHQEDHRHKDRYSPFGFMDCEKSFIFLDTQLANWEISPQKYEVVIVGNCTDICVHYTAAEFRNRNFDVIIPADCVDTYNLTEEDCERLWLLKSKVHIATEINKFFLEHHFPNILGIKVVPSVEDIL